MDASDHEQDGAPVRVVQPMPKPLTWDEYERAKPRMIDTYGRLLVSRMCSRCRVTHFTVEPCVSDVPCPTCGSIAARCTRPSEHDATEWHTARVTAFNQLRDELEAAGLPQVAIWGTPGELRAGLPDLANDAEER